MNINKNFFSLFLLNPKFCISLIFLIGTSVRLIYLYLNTTLEITNVWPSISVESLDGANNNILNKILDGSAYKYGDYNEKFIAGSERGLFYLHSLFAYIFGESKHLYVQITNLLIDSLMIFVIFYISKKLKNIKFGLICSLIYAFFLPQIYVASQPTYDCYLTFSLLLMISSTLKLFDEKKNYSSIFFIFFILLIFNEFRSVIAFYGIFSALLLFFFLKSETEKKKILLLFSVSILAIILSSLMNFKFRGEFQPIRSSAGHQFFSGLSQFDISGIGPGGDAASYRYYVEKSGKKPDHIMSDSYNDFLEKEAIKYILDKPVIYLRICFQRIAKIIFPNIMASFIADDTAYWNQILTDHSNKREIYYSEHGRFSYKGLQFLVIQEPLHYSFTFFLRVFLMILFPLCIYSVYKDMKNINTLISSIPLFYFIVFLTPLSVKPILLNSLYASQIPLILLGFNFTISHIRKKNGK